MNRNDLISIMAQAIRDAPCQPPVDVAEQAATATGERRALYHTYGLDARAAMIRRAQWIVRQETVER